MSTSLKASCWPADISRPALDVTTGDALRAATAQAPDRTALVELVPKVRKFRLRERLQAGELQTLAERVHGRALNFRSIEGYR